MPQTACHSLIKEKFAKIGDNDKLSGNAKLFIVKLFIPPVSMQ